MDDEEIQVWSVASSKLSAFRDKYNEPASREAIDRVNRSISAWPSISGDDGEPMESFETVKKTYEKISKGLSKIKSSADAESKAIDEALETLSVLIGLRRAPETPIQQDKRKRHRGSSPLPTPAASTPLTVNKITISVKGDRDRASESSVTSSAISKGDAAKARIKFNQKQFPLQAGRKVAYHPTPPPKEKGANHEEIAEPPSEWMLAVVTRCINQEKNKYEVQDADMQEDGQFGQLFTANAKSLVPLPEPEAPAGSLSHPSSYPDFPAGHAVLALYPDTSCFYRAVVQEDRVGVGSSSKPYKLKFDDDEDQRHIIPAHWVVDFPEK